MREAPVYGLDRAATVLAGSSAPAEEALQVAARIPEEPPESPELTLFG